ncbi:MAG: FixH family protein [Betaproteobacteria bacterium]|nr:FixH family protein [Betaproteobacteria bacterium]
MSHAVIAPIAWYRQPWPWLLMLMPALALVGGLITLWLALSTNHAMVVDDYYREGKAINRTLARDAAAARLGLSAQVMRGPDGSPVVTMASAPGAALPAALTLRVIHATRAEFDQIHTLQPVAPGRYAGSALALPAEGRWHLVIEGPEATWRLTASVAGFGQPVTVAAQP